MEALVQEVEFGRMLFVFVLSSLGAGMLVTWAMHQFGGR